MSAQEKSLKPVSVSQQELYTAILIWIFFSYEYFNLLHLILYCIWENVSRIFVKGSCTSLLEIYLNMYITINTTLMISFLHFNIQQKISTSNTCTLLKLYYWQTISFNQPQYPAMECEHFSSTLVEIADNVHEGPFPHSICNLCLQYFFRAAAIFADFINKETNKD